VSRRSLRTIGRPLLVATLLFACSCARNPAPDVDLTPARSAVAAARAAGADTRARDELKRAVERLAEAEALVSRHDRGTVPRAEMLAALAAAEAALATVTARGTSAPPAAGRSRSSDSAALKRLEDQVELLTRELEMADAEIMRSRAKGIDTKAEASSAIAEARILMKRAGEDRTRATEVKRCRELIDEAEKELERESYGAARWRALKCQRLLEDTRRPAGAARAQ
jgi:hypothetical protein